MKRVVVLIDGFNLYHALDYSVVPANPYINPHRYRKYKWIDLFKLGSSYVYNKADTLNGVYWFTTYAHWDSAKVLKHTAFVKAQETQGVNVVFGEFKKKTKYCKVCKNNSHTYEEKQTDVNIALTLLRLAVENAYDKVIIISGDTDLIPAIKTVREMYPEKEIGVVIPIGKISEAFKKTADFYHKMKESHLISALLADPFTCSDSSTINCPATWK
ncbi:MAG: NYN domain-containing protein [Pyrinomonadaceae bacterium]